MASQDACFSQFLAMKEQMLETAKELERFLKNTAARQQSFKNEQFDLFFVQEVEVAEALISSMSPNEGDYILKQGECGQTALHFQCTVPRPDVVEYLINLPDFGKKLLMMVDDFNATALHVTSSVKVANLLLQAVPSSEKRKFLLWPNSAGQTAVHVAVTNGNVDLITYLMSEINNHCDLLNFNQTPLHCAGNVLGAKSFLECVEPDKRTDFILAPMGFPKSTVLHLAVMNDKVDIVKYLLTSTDAAKQLLYHKNLTGETALFVVQNSSTAAELLELVESVEGDETLETFLTQRDFCGQTAFHSHALFGRAEVLESIIDFMDEEVKKRMLNLRAITGRIALHCAADVQCVELLVEAVDISERKSYIVSTDRLNFTPMATAAQRGFVEVLESLLTYLQDCIDEDEDDDDDISIYLEQETNTGETVYQLAYSSANSKGFHTLFEELGVTGDSEMLTKADEQGNTALLHIAAMSVPEAFAQTIMALPLAQRRQILTQKNPRGANCRSLIKREEFDLAYYIEKIFGARVNLPDVPLKYVYQAQFSGLVAKEINPPEVGEKDRCNTWKIMHYALNEFSAKAQFLLNGLQSSIPPKLEVVKSVNTRELQGVPKVIIYNVQDVNSGETEMDIVPPGPDYMICSVRMTGSSCSAAKNLNLDSGEDVDIVLSQLVQREEVESITINSTYGRHSSTSGGNVDVPSKHVLISSLTQGKALIICNRRGREGYEKELKDAAIVLEIQLGLQVEIACDLTADEMVDTVKKFAKSSSHCPIAALTVMSHGALQGDICGNDEHSVCKVQSLVDTLTNFLPVNTIKLLFLSFCRGAIAQRNRTRYSWECNDLYRMRPHAGFGVSNKELTAAELESEWRHNPLPAVKLSANCYICYSTMPDSKSLRGEMFKAMREHLGALYEYHSSENCGLEVAETSTDFATADGLADDTTEAIIVADDTVTATAISDMFTDAAKKSVTAEDAESSPIPPNVRLLELITDVSGIVREKSRFTQYMNFCYLMDKNSKTVWLEIRPTTKSSPTCFTNFQMQYLPHNTI